MCSSIEACVSSRIFGSGGLLVLLAACGPDQAPPPTPTTNPSDAWGIQLSHLVQPDGRVDLDALRADRALLDEYIGWIAEHGPETDKYRSSDDNRRLAWHLNAVNAYALWFALDGVDAPYAPLRVRLDGELVRLDRHLLHTVIATYEEPLALAAIWCAAPGCPPMRPELYQRNSLDAELADQMRRWTDGGLVRAEGSTFVFASHLRPWLDYFERWSDAKTPCAIVEPYAQPALLVALQTNATTNTGCSVRWE